MQSNGIALGALLILFAAHAAQAADAPGPQQIETRRSAEAGQYLIDGKGRALYVFTKGKGQAGAEPKAKCGDDCATAWPPALANTAPKAAEGADGSLVTLEPHDGKQQVVYDGWPLHYFVGDRGTGQATGHGVEAFGGTFYLAAADGGPALGDARTINPFEGLALKRPECVRHDPARDRYVLSNVNGEFTAVDDNGFITRATPDGMADLKWIAGGKNGVTLNAPKGIQISGGTLYVADIDHLRLFDAETGQPTRSIKFDGARFLNGLAVAEDGTVFITDTGTKDVPGAVYRVSPEGEAEAIAKGRDLKRPNGIDFDAQGRLKVATFAGDEVLTISRDGELLSRDKLGAGQLDGLLVRDDGGILVSSWKGKHVVRLDPDGKAETLITGLVQPACFEVDARRGLLLIPEVKKDRVTVAPLPTD